MKNTRRVRKHGRKTVHRDGGPGKPRRVFDNRSPHDPRKRNAKENREAGIRSRYRRCQRCKKLRMYWRPVNKLYGNGARDNYCEPKSVRTAWKVIDGVLSCHICVERTA